MQEIITDRTDFTAWSNLLHQAITTPGLLSEAYSFYHSYSLSNQLMAIVQCAVRKIEAGPIATYPAWKERGRQVKRGERALTLCMPISVKSKEREGEHFTKFVLKRNWFALSQTEGEPIEPAPTPAWSKKQALSRLNITEIPFDKPDGNCQGFARQRSIAISPLAVMPYKTTFHEIAHVAIGHTLENDFTDLELTPRNLREVEAESVALLVCDALQLPGTEYCRGYIQHWIGGGGEIPAESAQKIFKAADQILKAGQVITISKPIDLRAESNQLAPSDVEEYHDWLNKLESQDDLELEESYFISAAAQKGT